MWSDEQLNDAVQVLWSASEFGAVQKVVDKSQEPAETYIVANSVTYTDPLYVQALEKLLTQNKLKSAGNAKDNREAFDRCEGKAC